MKFKERSWKTLTRLGHKGWACNKTGVSSSNHNGKNMNIINCKAKQDTQGILRNKTGNNCLKPTTITHCSFSPFHFLLNKRWCKLLKTKTKTCMSRIPCLYHPINYEPTQSTRDTHSFQGNSWWVGRNGNPNMITYSINRRLIYGISLKFYLTLQN